MAITLGPLAVLLLLSFHTSLGAAPPPASLDSCISSGADNPLYGSRWLSLFNPFGAGLILVKFNPHQYSAGSGHRYMSKVCVGLGLQHDQVFCDGA